MRWVSYSKAYTKSDGHIHPADKIKMSSSCTDYDFIKYVVKSMIIF